MIKTIFRAAVLFLPGIAFAEGDSRITDITLFEAGLAEIGLDAGGQEEVTLTIPLKDIDDVLKSLVVTGEFTARPVIRLSGENPVEDAFMASPVGPDRISDIAGILSSIRGTKVTLTGLDRSVEGIVMGVSEERACTGDAPCRREVTLLDDNGTIVRFPLDGADGSDAGISLGILDEKIVSAMQTGLAALSEQSNGKIRTVNVDLGGEADNAGLSYVIAAPMWKTAYRTVLEGDDVSLQAWAVVENATPSEWTDVTLTISSGSPVTLQARLHSREWGRRDIYRTEASPASSNRMAMQSMSQGFSSADMMQEEVAMAPEPLAGISADASATETLVDSRFTFPEPISIASGEMISVPFLAEDLDASRLTVWNGGTGKQTGAPDMILEIENDLPVRLPAGIMTIHASDTGYIGDASFPMLAPGDDSSVKFGTDAKITISEQRTARRFERSLTISRGVVTLIDEEVNETTYLISAPGDTSRELMIDHPYVEIATRTATGAAEEEVITKPGRRQVVRYTVVTEPDEQGSLVVEEVVPIRNSIRIGNMDPNTLLVWSNRATSKKDKRLLEDIAALMRLRSDAEALMARLEVERNGLTSEQGRVANLIEAVPDQGEMQVRYLETLRKTEDRLEVIAQQKADAEREYRSLTVRINRMLAE